MSSRRTGRARGTAARASRSRDRGVVGPFVALEAPARTVARTGLRRFLVLTCVGVVLARATYVTQALRHDEGGLLFIARRWHTGGEFLYGDYFVDRPPLLMAIFRMAATSEWDQAVRVLAIGAALAFVLAAWHAGTSLSGHTGGRWSVAVAAGLMCSPAVAADQADGELFGAALVMAGVALALQARTAYASRQWWLAGAAGVCAGAAPLVKQNLLDGLVFLVVLVTVAIAGANGRHAIRTAGAALVGALLPYVVLWVCAGVADVDASSAWREVVAFRRDAFSVIWSHRPQASIDRFGGMVVLGLVSGLLPLLAVWFVAARRRPGLRRPERRAVTALILFGTVAVLAGGELLAELPVAAGTRRGPRRGGPGPVSDQSRHLGPQVQPGGRRLGRRRHLGDRHRLRDGASRVAARAAGSVARPSQGPV